MYRNLLHALDVEPVEVAVGRRGPGSASTTVALDATVAAHGPLAGMVLASPVYPTGSMMSRDQFAAIGSWCAANDVRLVSDEIYHGITYPAEGSAATARGTCAWSFDRTSVTVSSFSKYWGMTGWRIGWALVPDDLLGAVHALAGNVALCPPTPAQRAALGAFTERSYAEADRAVEVFVAKRKFLYDSLHQLGSAAVRPSRRGLLPLGWHSGTARRAPVVDRVVPRPARRRGGGAGAGHRHGPCRREVGSIRLSFAASMESFSEAVERITSFQQRG